MKKLLTQRTTYRLPLMILLAFVLSLNAVAQDGIAISGKVFDSNGKDLLPGASIVEKGTGNGTITDFDGNFKLTVSQKSAVLVVSFMGYTTQEIPVGDKTTFQINLSMDAQSLEEVVVVGYGTMKKRDVTGSVGSVDTEKLLERSVGNPMEAMQGAMAGVNISSSSGRLGDDFDITIRGKNTLKADAPPLFIVDGVPTDGISFLNPQDIERIDILKDASSTAIYGSRGSNGVVLVTTKSGTKAKSGVTVSLDSYYGIRKAARLPKMMDGETWAYYHESAYLATTNLTDPMSITPDLLDSKVYGTSNDELRRRFDANETFDWYDAVLQDGYSANNYVSVSGVDGGTSFNLGFGVQNESGLIENETLDKYSFKFGLTHKLNDKITFGTNTTVGVTNMEQGSRLAMQEAFRLNPFLTPYAVDENNKQTSEYFVYPGKLRDVNGDYLINKTSTYNPLLEIANASNQTKRWRIINSSYFQYKVLDWLTFKSTFSSAYDNKRNGIAYGELTNDGSKNGPSSEIDKRQNFNYTWDNQLNFDYKLNDHSFNFMALQSIYESITELSYASSRAQPFETGFHNVGSGDAGTYNMSSGYIKTSLASFAARFNYSYKGKYLVTLSNRWDGSSLLSEGKKWQSFPSAAVAWRVTEEDFMKSLEAVSDFKLRASYGFTGNNNIGAYSTINILDAPMYYEFNGTNVVGWSPKKLANNALTWEKTREFNFGFDFGFMKNRISGSIDFYDRLSDELLQDQKLPLESGWEEISANVGSVNNRGVELSLNTVNVDNGTIRWETGFTFARNVNKIVSLYGQDEFDDVGNKWFIGEPVQVEYDYEFDGIWQATERERAAVYSQLEGQTKVVDQNNDNVIDPSDDRIILGSVFPDWTGSITTRLQVKDFDLSASIITSQGVYVYSDFHRNFADTRDRGRMKLDISWYVPENGAGVPAQYSNEYPQARNMGKYGRHLSDTQRGMQNYKDASYTKVKNISVGYTLKKSLIQKVGIKSARIYFNVVDPFVFTKYEGFDPEWAAASFEVGRVGSVTYQLGANIKF